MLSKVSKNISTELIGNKKNEFILQKNTERGYAEFKKLFLKKLLDYSVLAENKLLRAGLKKTKRKQLNLRGRKGGFAKRFKLTIKNRLKSQRARLRRLWIIFKRKGLGNTQSEMADYAS